MATKTADLSTTVLVTVTYVAMIAVNALANSLTLNGRTTGGVSDPYPNLFNPAALTFSVWGVIYLFLGLHVLYQWGVFRKGGAKNPALLKKIGVLFSATSLVNAAWIFAWHYDFIGVSTLLMAALLILLVGIIQTLRGVPLTGKETVFVRLPFSFYLGWITVATVLNVTVWLVSVEWGRFGLSEVLWTVAIISVAAIIGTVTMLRNKDIAYGAILLWAFAGILIKHSTAAGFDGEYVTVIGTTIVWLIVFAAAITTLIIGLRRKGVVNA